MAERLIKNPDPELDIAEELSKPWHHPPSNLCCAKWLNVVISKFTRARTDSAGHQAEPGGMEYQERLLRGGDLHSRSSALQENGAYICFWANDKIYFYGFQLLIVSLWTDQTRKVKFMTVRYFMQVKNCGKRKVEETINHLGKWSQG